MTNIEILKEAQAKIIDNYDISNSIGDVQIRELDLIADITELIIKYKRRINHEENPHPI